MLLLLLFAVYCVVAAGLLLTPAYYLAKSKGHNWGIPITIAGCLGAGSFLATVGADPVVLTVISFAIPGVCLLITFLIPPEVGAPGKTYLTIRLTCPECGEEVSFPRRREGNGVLCPECGELIHVPKDDSSPEPSAVQDDTDVDGESEVCFRIVGLPEDANLLASALSESGVPARVTSDDGKPVAYFASALGYRVMIDAARWDEAERIEQRYGQGEPAPWADG
jgi:rRNA maturation protein Nop10